MGGVLTLARALGGGSAGSVADVGQPGGGTLPAVAWCWSCAVCLVGLGSCCRGALVVIPCRRWRR